MRSLLLGLLGLIVIAACSKSSKSGDECERVMTKSRPVLGEMARMRGVELDDKSMAKLVERCRTGLAKGNRDPSMDCVLAAKDDAGVRDCYMKGFERYMERSKAIRDGAPPVGSAAPSADEPGTGSATHP